MTVKDSYDYLIVGAGLTGAVFAHEAIQRGKSCLVIDRRNHIAGNAFTRSVEDINVHVYGAHIFHTSIRRVWDYVNQFAEFNNYVNSPVAIWHDELYNLPFNMNTFNQLWGVKTPAEAQAKIAEAVAAEGIEEPRNLEEQALSLVGRDVYEKLIKGYTEKQWGRPCCKLPASIIKRIPCRMRFDNNYFNDRWQGIPIGGYTALIERMLAGTDVLLECSYRDFIAEHPQCAARTIYCGPIDEFYDYCFGYLEYRSLRFSSEVIDEVNHQGNAVVNYTDRAVPYTRIIEHKHFEYGTQPKTVVTREYPAAWQPGDEAYYPINDDRNTQLYEQYADKACTEGDIVFAGRLGGYKYYDMDKAINAALDLVDAELGV
ncbi:UDP-galactopyranose mutase [Cryptobacterium curtum]|uniref:UDP-galactopyranose mutase n=1 Tax=Cryptobacterium curtum TaxID=84163 RepID=UPI00248EBAF9|nr:UDP-galactopyranose mutase [Cryptobacterium curtum]